MAMITYTATLSDGTIIKRKSDNTYTHAWAVVEIATGVVRRKGFSCRADLARQAAAPHHRPAYYSRQRLRHPACKRDYARFAKEEGFANTAEWIASLDERSDRYAAAHRLEVVPVN